MLAASADDPGTSSLDRLCPDERAGDAWLDFAGHTVAICASIWFALAAAWEFVGPFDAGHDAATAGVGIAALEMWRWGTIAPVLEFLTEAPQPSDYYCHHPWGVFWTTAILVRLFGSHDWVLRVAPVAMSAATPPLIYLGARRLWGGPSGALAALTFALTPLAVAFADFNALEVPVMFGLALAIWALLCLLESWRWRYLVLSLLGFAEALNADWPAFFFVLTLLGCGFLRGTVLAHGGFFAVSKRRFWFVWMLLASLTLGIALFYVIEFHRFGQLGELLRQGRARSHGFSTPLAQVLSARRHWLELSFTPVGIALGAIALPVLLARVVALRRDLEVLPLIVFATATCQYLVFKQGADVHVFWPQYYALYVAYGMGALSASLTGVAQRLAPQRAQWRRWGPRASFVFALVPLGAIAPDAMSTLRYARATGKRFDDNWRLIHQDADKVAVARLVGAQLPPGQSVAVHFSAKPSWALEWALQRPVQEVNFIPNSGAPLFVDSRFADPALLSLLVKYGSVTAYGPFWSVQITDHPHPVRGYRLLRSEPRLWERYFVNANDPSFDFEPDPFHTWELRFHFGLPPYAPPHFDGARDTEDLRIAHNMAVASGAEDRAVRLRHELESRLRPVVGASRSDVALVLGYEWLSGVAPRVRLHVLASGATAALWQLEITSVVRRRPWSTVSPPRAVRKVGMPFPLPSTLWRSGFIYAAESEVREQPGVEQYRVQLVSSDAVGARVPLFVLE